MIQSSNRQKAVILFLIVISFLLFSIPTVSFADDAVESWVKRYNGPGNDWDRATAIAMDRAGNVYVTGSSIGNRTRSDYTTIKYDSSGNELWVKRYNGPGDDWARATAIVLDDTGNIYVTGESYGVGTNYDYVTIKYDTNGNQLWVRRYNGLENSTPRGIATDGIGNVYVTGESYNHYATIKYDSSGNELWVKRYGSWGNNGGANAIVVDKDEGLYIVGGIYGFLYGVGSYSEYATIKYDLSGNDLWVRYYDTQVITYDNIANAVAVDEAGNVYVTGTSEGWMLSGYIGSMKIASINIDYTTIKYNSAGDQLWVKRYNGLGSGRDEATGIVIDASGNIYVTGKSLGNGTGYDYATVKYDSSGNEIWAKRYNGLGSNDDIVSGITMDKAGSIYVTGKSLGNGTGYDYATVKYDSSGNEIWAKRYNGLGNNNYDEANAIVVDEVFNVYVTGQANYTRYVGGSPSYGFTSDYATIKYTQTLSNISSGGGGGGSPSSGGGSPAQSIQSTPTGKIKGRIISTSGLAILGTPVAINGIRTATNLNGEFEFTFVADGVYTLFYDSLGYVSQSQILVVLNGGITIGPTVVMSPSVVSVQTVSSVKGKKGRRVRKVVRVRKKVVKRRR